MNRRLALVALGCGLATNLPAADHRRSAADAAGRTGRARHQPAVSIPDGLVAQGADGFQQLIGHWEVVDGALRGNEFASDRHTASCIYRTSLTDAVITAQDRLGDAERIAILIRDDSRPNHHLARVFVTPEALWVQHMSGIAKSTRSEVLKKKEAAFDPRQWHTVVIEVAGDQILARVGEHEVQARHPRFQDAKGIVGMLVKGRNAAFRDVAIWRAKPKPDPRGSATGR